MKERKFVRGTKGARMSGTKTDFRNYRKEMDGSNIGYKEAFHLWSNFG